VVAQDKATSKQQNITITASSGLTKEEIEKMVKEAEEHEKEDRAARELAEARNKLDTLVYRAEKDSAEWGDKLEGSVKSQLEKALEAAKKTLKESEDHTALNRAHDELMQAFSAAGQKLYEAQAGATPGAEAEAQGGPEPGAGATAETEEPEVVEADYEIVEEEKKD
jgi:molecular chaperone DnaK